MNSVREEIEQQKASNRLSARQSEFFASHRATLTNLIMSQKDTQKKRLCVLGAGNCNDLDLNYLAQMFSEVHLVDIDREAVGKARVNLPKDLFEKVHLHAPLDISGAHKHLVKWRNMQVTPEALIAFPESAVKSIINKLPGEFDYVVSACLLSQILLVFRKLLGESHPLFEAGTVTLLVTHLRLLLALLQPHGKALLVTDISSNDICELQNFNAAHHGLPFLEQLLKNHEVFTYLRPDLLQQLVTQDPSLNASSTLGSPMQAWLWQNGPIDRFLVYAMQLCRID